MIDFAWLRRWLRPKINVCLDCIRVTDEHAGMAGDYSLCSRCRKPITSITGFEVRE